MEIRACVLEEILAPTPSFDSVSPDSPEFFLDCCDVLSWKNKISDEAREFIGAIEGYFGPTLPIDNLARGVFKLPLQTSEEEDFL